VLTSDAWLAGLYEGEGNLHLSREGTWELQLAMTDRDVIEAAHRHAGVGTVTARKRNQPHWKDQWAWRVSNRPGILSVLARIYPYLGERRRGTAAAYLDWYAAGCPRQVEPEVLARMAQNSRNYRRSSS
jgi:hypothetical protein